jgi:hypothetical protein
MATQSRPTVDPQLYPDETVVQPGGSAVAWPAIWAGSAVALATTLILLAAGSGLGLAAASPWPGVGAAPQAFTIGAGIWLIVMQWLSSALGGYIAGRLRTRWHSLHGDEVFFRDTAHGLLTWATSTIVVVALAVISAALSAAAAAPPDPGISAEAAEAARKVAASFAIFTAIAMLVGAFIASVAGVIGGRLRDKHP